MKMRSSRVLAKLRAGEVVSSVKLNLSDPRAGEIAAMSGFDCVWLCMEHVPNTLHDIENTVRAIKIYDIDTCVRVPRGSYSDLVRPLELDATGIMVPHVMNVEDAREVANQTRFHPIGRRPVDGGNADGAYCMIPFVEYIEQANRERFIIAQIEDPEAVDDLDEIAQVEGIDMLFFGPGDYSHSIGVPGEITHPKVLDARKLVAKVAHKHGKFAGTTGSTENVRSLVDMGYNFVNLTADVVALTQHFTKVADEFKAIVAKV